MNSQQLRASARGHPMQGGASAMASLQGSAQGMVPASAEYRRVGLHGEGAAAGTFLTTNM
jgi:hypothetical protein